MAAAASEVDSEAEAAAEAPRRRTKTVRHKSMVQVELLSVQSSDPEFQVKTEGREGGRARIGKLSFSRPERGRKERKNGRNYFLKEMCTTVHVFRSSLSYPPLLACARRFPH